MNQKKIYDCIVVGGGPSGLSVAYYLSKFDLHYAVLEKGAIGQSWRSMSDGLTLLSPWWTNLLPGSYATPFNMYRRVRREVYLEYLCEYAKTKKLNIRESVTVTKIVRKTDFFILSSNDGVIYSRSVVFATGYFSSPFVPRLVEQNDNSILEIHASEFVNEKKFIEEYGKVSRVLVVGKRVTAGQMLEAFFDMGCRVDLSCRGTLNIRNNDTTIGRIRDNLYFLWEYLRIRVQPNLKAESRPEMDGGVVRMLLESGVSRVYPLPRRIEKGVVFFDGEKAEFDVIVYATGYKPSLNTVRGVHPEITGEPEYQIANFQSTFAKGLFFIGLDNLRNFRSRYLRGLTSDSLLLAKEIRKYLRQ